MTDIDNLVDQILVRNASRSPELVVWFLKSKGLDVVHVSKNKYRIVKRYEWMYQATDAAKKTRKRLLEACPEMRITNVDAYAESYMSIVEFEVENGR